MSSMVIDLQNFQIKVILVFLIKSRRVGKKTPLLNVFIFLISLIRENN